MTDPSEPGVAGGRDETGTGVPEGAVVADNGDGAQHSDEALSGDGDDNGSAEAQARHDSEPGREPVLVAHGLGLRTRHGWVFRDLDLSVAPGAVTALVAPAGTGRSSAVLALTGRMRVTDGTVRIAGRDAITDPRAARARTAVARVADLIGPEERLSIDESVTERCLIEGVRPAHGRTAFAAACERMGARFDGDELVEALAPHRQAILALALAAVRRAEVIVLDDTDRGVTAEGEREIYRAALELARSGPSIVTTTTRRDALAIGVVVVDLATPESSVIAPDGVAAAPGDRVTAADNSAAAPGDRVTAADSSVAAPEDPVTSTSEDER